MTAPPTCKECGAVLKWGRFAYGQVLCWHCFCLEVQKLYFATANGNASVTVKLEQQLILQRLLDYAAELFNQPRFDLSNYILTNR